MKITLNTIIQRNNEILTSDVDGEKVMMSIQQGEYYGLGKTGTFIWDHIESPIKVRELIQLIVQAYNLDEEQCFHDIIPFLNNLVEKDLISATY